MTPREELLELDGERLRSHDVVITTYGYLGRLAVLTEFQWDLTVIDEAQAIKNPSAQQTRAVKRLASGGRFALTGTPIESRLGDLWSLFDFVSPGLLGMAKEFTRYTRALEKRAHKSPECRDTEVGDPASVCPAPASPALRTCPLRTPPPRLFPEVTRRLGRPDAADLDRSWRLSVFSVPSTPSAASS